MRSRTLTITLAVSFVLALATAGAVVLTTARDSAQAATTTAAPTITGFYARYSRKGWHRAIRSHEADAVNYVTPDEKDYQGCLTLTLNRASSISQLEVGIASPTATGLKVIHPYKYLKYLTKYPVHTTSSKLNKTICMSDNTLALLDLYGKDSWGYQTRYVVVRAKGTNGVWSHPRFIGFVFKLMDGMSTYSWQAADATVSDWYVFMPNAASQSFYTAASLRRFKSVLAGQFTYCQKRQPTIAQRVFAAGKSTVISTLFSRSAVALVTKEFKVNPVSVALHFGLAYKKYPEEQFAKCLTSRWNAAEAKLKMTNPTFTW